LNKLPNSYKFRIELLEAKTDIKNVYKKYTEKLAKIYNNNDVFVLEFKDGSAAAIDEHRTGKTRIRCAYDIDKLLRKS